MSTESPASPVPQPPEPAAGAPLRSVDLLQALLEGTPHSVYFKDRASRFTLISRSLARLLGLADPQEAYGKTDRDFFSAEHAEQALADERRILETGQPIIEFVEKETWPDGRVTWASSTKLPLRDPAGHIVGTFGISRDITARKIVEQRLHEARCELAEAARRAAGAAPATGVVAEALTRVERARGGAERIRRRATRTSAEAMGRLAGRLAHQLANSSPGHQLAVDLCALAASSASDQTSLVDDLDELQQHLEQITRILALAPQ